MKKVFITRWGGSAPFAFALILPRRRRLLSDFRQASPLHCRVMKQALSGHLWKCITAEEEMEETPHIIICLPISEQEFGMKVARLLTSRGLQVSLINTPEQLSLHRSFAAICVVIGSSSIKTQLVDAAIAAASTAQRPIMPLLRGSERDMPMSLRETQWSDFSRDFLAGYRELLLALDMQRMSRWPYDTSIFDAEVTLARARNGLTLPNWTVYRGFVREERHVTPATLLAFGAVLFITLVVWLYQPANWWFYILVGSIGAYASFHDYRDRVYRTAKDGPIIVISPHGFLSNSPSGLEAFAFSTVKSIEDRSVAVPEKRGRLEFNVTVLTLIQRNGVRKDIAVPVAFDVVEIQNRRPYTSYTSVKIVDAITAAFQRSQQVQVGLSAVQRPLYFVSYAHNDEQDAFTLEASLRTNGLDAWVDRSRLRAGVLWEQEISSAIQQSSALLLLISPDAINSGYVEREIELAQQWRKPIIGILVKTCRQIREDWRKYMYADMRRPLFRNSMSVLDALDRHGVLPKEMSTRREAYPVIVLARAMLGKPRSDEQVFVSKWMTNLRLLFIVVIAVFFVGYTLWYPPIICGFYFFSIYIISNLVNQTFQGQRDIIVVFPSGLAQYIKGRPATQAFAIDDNWAIKSSSWIDGTICQVRDAKAFYQVSARFRSHRKIAEHVADTFKTWRGQQ